MRYLWGLVCVLALSVTGCGGDGGSGGRGGSGGIRSCGGDEDCDNGNACTEHFCDDENRVCEYQPMKCADDANECTSDACDPGAGCEYTAVADGTTCDGGTCRAGVCELAGRMVPCTENGVRNAVRAGGGPFTFDCEGATTVTINGHITVEKDVILDGEANLTIDANGSGRAFEVGDLAMVELRRMTITGGVGSDCAGIRNDGILALVEVTVSGNHCSNPACSGGGICNRGSLGLRGSTVSGNVGDGIDNFGVLGVQNSTISGNTGCLAGGILVGGGSVALVHSTIFGNETNCDTPTAISFAGPTFSDGKEPATVVVTNSVLGGTCGPLPPDVPPVDLISGGYNVESPGDTCGFDQPTDQANVTPEQLNLEPLADNGGPTPTRALDQGSVAIDVIPVAECVDQDGERLTTDQRGFPRPGGSMCDVGAFEVQP